MSRTTHNTVQRWMLCIALSAAMPALAHAWQSAPQNTVQAPGPGQGVVLDRIVAIVNGDTILESDIDEELRFEEIQPYRGATNTSREQTIQRLIDRALILQQSELE